MCLPAPTLYPLVLGVLKVVLGPLPAARLGALCEVVVAVLVSQSLHPADLARALAHPQTPRARQALRRVRRLYGRGILTSAALTPLLVRAALRLVRDAEVTLVVDSTRCVRWEVFTAGVRWHGRVLPVAWQVLP